jgi:3-oxoadipate enol-lactonase
VALHHEVAGPADGHVVLMGASLGATLAIWDAQAGPLAERFRVVRFDHRGHGGSPAPPGPYDFAELGSDVLALLDRLGVARASYCGLSLGSMLGIWLAANAPERFERLVLVGTAAYVPPPDAWEERAAAVERAGTVDAVADGVIARWLTERFARERPDVAAALRAGLAATSPVAYAAYCRALGGMDLRADLPRIAAPTLVVAAAQDPSTPPEHGEAVAAAIPDARFELLSPSAHIAAVERADDVTRLLLDHLAPAA